MNNKLIGGMMIYLGGFLVGAGFVSLFVCLSQLNAVTKLEAKMAATHSSIAEQIDILEQLQPAINE